MADLPPPKADPTAEQATAPGAKEVPEEAATATVTGEATQEKPAAAASSVTETVTNAAATATSAVKDNMFSMFGGGPKKEKREEADDADEPSGASKGKAPEVRQVIFSINTCKLMLDRRRTQRMRSRMSNLPPLSTSPKKLTPKPTRNSRSRRSRCALSFSNSTESRGSGRSGVLAMSGY